MGGYIQTGIGIIVSIVFFLLGYRQTVGAKKERISTANTEVEKILIRRIVNENYELSVMGMKRLLEGKARDLKLKIEDLYSEEQVLNSIYTRIMETDFITPKQRTDILSKLIPIIEQVDKDLESDEVVDKFLTTSDYYKKRSRTQLYSLSIIGVFASIFGGLLTIVPFLGNNSLKNNFNLSLLTALASLVVIGFIILVLRRFKDSQQNVTLSSSSQVIENAIKFEKEVAKIISKKGYNVSVADINKSYDFLITVNQNKILIEVKAWKNSPPYQMVKRTAERLKEAIVSESATEAIIVTQKPVQVREIPKEDHVKIMTLSEFKSYLR